ncbi:alcohol dehydrogenase catalytic domain-containing protein [Cognatiluteimonas telluris]|uniref:alcohol dehydrogenase catalytic domain-containing protein n=1 Tax=Cognatiluteimonas telluris TaxID=1104775 RepID=UPI001FAE9F7F|nr:alcohol dehydrogenase catalytic domain-containing protein [Lysobacter telluris]
MGTIFGHEFTGIVEEVGGNMQNPKPDDHVLVPSNIFCGTGCFCPRELHSNCHDVNPEATAVGGVYGCSHAAGGYDGGQAQYLRVPFTDIGPTKVPGKARAQVAWRALRRGRPGRHRPGGVVVATLLIG